MPDKTIRYSDYRTSVLCSDGIWIPDISKYQASLIFKSHKHIFIFHIQYNFRIYFYKIPNWKWGFVFLIFGLKLMTFNG